jgi:hypothetical protein
MANFNLATMDVLFQTKGYEGVRQQLEKIEQRGQSTARSFTKVGGAAGLSAGQLRRLESNLHRVTIASLGARGPIGALGATLLTFGTTGFVGIAVAAGLAAILFLVKKLRDETTKTKEELEKVQAEYLKLFAPNITAHAEEAAALRKAELALQQYNRHIVLASGHEKGALEAATKAWDEYLTALQEAAIAHSKLKQTVAAPPVMAPPTPATPARFGGTRTPEAVAQSMRVPLMRSIEPQLVAQSELDALAWDDWAERMMAMVDESAALIETHIEQTIGDAIFNGFQAAFGGEGLGGIFAALGKTVLAGLGRMFIDLGMAMISFGTIMTALRAALLNLFTSGPAALAAGAALVALGSTFTAIASGGGGGGGGRIGGSHGIGGAFRQAGVDMWVDKYTNKQILWGPGTKGMATKPPLVFNVFGANDPSVQRVIVETIKKAHGRGIR